MRRDPRSWLILLALAASVSPAAAGEAPLTLKGTAAYHRVDVPPAVMGRTRYADLSDLRVINARGEAVPHAWLDEPLPVDARETTQRLQFFSQPAAASAADGARGGWIIDARPLKGSMLTLELALPERARGAHAFSIEYSDDLQRWSTHTSQAYLVSLDHEGQQLRHTGFELGGLRARYLRLQPLPGHPLMPLASVQVTAVDHLRASLPVQWSDPVAPAACTADACEYTLPHHVPLERLTFQLGTVNTLARVSLQAQYGDTLDAGPPSPARRRRDRLRDRLTGVRSKSEPPPAPAAATWMPLRQDTLYRLQTPQGELQSPELVLDAGHVARLRLVPAGGVVQLGAPPPTLRVGARVASLVFLAREPAPFRLSWGGEVAGSALPLSQLMPARRPGDALPDATAVVVLADVPQATPAPAAPAPASAAAPAGPDRKPWLWAVLLGAVGLMAAMAWSLLRPRAAPQRAAGD